MGIRRRAIDMTEGPILRNIILFALPLVLGNILQQLYTTVDTLVIGAYCGTASLAAVGTSSQPVEGLRHVLHDRFLHAFPEVEGNHSSERKKPE